MKEVNAIGVSSGMGEGAAYVIERKRLEIPVEPAADPALELIRFEEALGRAVKGAREMLESARSGSSRSSVDILDAYLALLEDPATTNGVRKLIGKSYNAPLAVKEAIGSIIRDFEEMDDAYMRERSFDIQDIMNTLIRELLGISPEDLSDIPPGSVIVAEELATSDTAKMDMNNIAGIITVTGGTNSHVSIVARSYEIPAIVGAGQIMRLVEPGDDVLVDGYHGRAYICPTSAAREKFAARSAAHQWEKEMYRRFAGLPSLTRDGNRVTILANIGGAGELNRAAESTAEGIGLYRSEFLFIGMNSMPDEKTQYLAYRAAASSMLGKPVTIRTLDIGSDKPLATLYVGREANPSLGYRSIRVSLDRADLFKTQLRAVLMAGRHGNVRLLLPFVSSVEEIQSAKVILESAKESLRREGSAFSEDIKVGVMIELPSAVMMAKELAAECDFFTIGTNDLIQHTLAVDRANSLVSGLYSHYHPAVLRMVLHTIKIAEEAGIECGMCGEAASDPLLIPALLGMGLRNFSMNAGEILRARAIISAVDAGEAAELARDVLNRPTARDVRWALEEYSGKTLGELFEDMSPRPV